jgi:hypothetical protein
MLARSINGIQAERLNRSTGVHLAAWSKPGPRRAKEMAATNFHSKGGEIQGDVWELTSMTTHLYLAVWAKTSDWVHKVGWQLRQLRLHS